MDATSLSVTGVTSAIYNFNARVIGCISHLCTVALHAIGSKQAARPDGVMETLRGVVSKLKGNLIQKRCMIQSIVSDIIPKEEWENYQRMLPVFNAVQNNEAYRLLEVEKDAFAKILTEVSKDPNYQNKFDIFINTKFSDLQRAHTILKDFFRLVNDDYYKGFVSKLTDISDSTDYRGEKLQPIEMRMLGFSTSMVKMVAALVRSGLSADDIAQKWQEVDRLSHSEFFEALRLNCCQDLEGTIYLNSRNTYELLSGMDTSLANTIEQIFTGRLSHIGIFVKPESALLQLSHVNFTGCHSITPVNPLMLPFHYSVALDIDALLPREVDEEERRELRTFFKKTFHELAQKEHPEIRLAGFSAEFWMTVLGHKTIWSHKLEDVSLPTDKPMMCSPYVGILFLQAVHAVNGRLEKKGYAKIRHPFGEHENLMHLDILRLMYLWRNMDVVRNIPIHPTVAKIVAFIPQLD